MGRGILLTVLWLLPYFFIVDGNAEGDALIAWKNTLTDPLYVFSSWNSTLANPCTWFRITCNDEFSVTRVDVQNANVSGELVPQLGVLSNLQYLELYNNHISGIIPAELGNLTNLVSLDLYDNNLTGSIPDTLGKLSKLRYLRLNNNTLSGEIPWSLTTITSLQVLDLSTNNLSGFIPVNGSFSLFYPTSFENNFYLKESPPPTILTSSLGGGVIAAIAGGVIVVAAILLGSLYFFWFVWWPTWRRTRHQDAFNVPAEEAPEVHLRQLKRFSHKELLVATNNFSHKNVLGTGGSRNFYKGRLADGSLVVVKRLKDELNQGGDLQFQTEAEMISRAIHCNLLRLKGFCIIPKERMLVYPYMANGSLASYLRERKESQPPLDWPTRKRIALGSAKGLAYLHEYCDPKILHRDIKAANILLDNNFNAIVGDFGISKLMNYKDTHVTTGIRGTIGYIAPEYFSTGKCSEKTDVFGYGIMLLELITGYLVLDFAQLAGNNDVLFLDWVKMLVDADLEENYTKEEADELIRIALLCTQSSPGERPRMSEVVRLLEGEGLVDKWETLIAEEVLPNALYYGHLPNRPYVVDSTSNHSPDELSGPR